MSINNDIIKELQKLKDIKPKDSYIADNRAKFLGMAQEKFEANRKESFSLAKIREIWQNIKLYVIIRRLATVALIICIVAGGSAGISFAAQNSIPGDIFYPVKLTIEKAQISLTINEEEKVKLEVEFAGRRLEELNKVKIKEEDDAKKKTENSKIALNNFKKNITTAHERLEKIKEQTFTPETVEVVKMVETKTMEYTKTLEEEKKKIDEEKKLAAIKQKDSEEVVEDDIVEDAADTKDVIKEAADVSEELSDKAVDIILEKHEKGEIEVGKEEIAEKVKNKLENVKDKISNLKEKADAIQKVKDIDSAGEEEVAAEEEVDVDDENEKADDVEGIEEDEEGEIEDEMEENNEERQATSTEELLVDLENIDEEDIDKIGEDVDEVDVLLEKGEVANAFTKVKEINKLAKSFEDKIEIAEEKIFDKIESDKEENVLDGEEGLPAQAGLEDKESLAEEEENGDEDIIIEENEGDEDTEGLEEVEEGSDLEEIGEVLGTTTKEILDL